MNNSTVEWIAMFTRFFSLSRPPFNREIVSKINAPNVADENVVSHGSANMTNSYKFERILTARKFMNILRAWRESKWASFWSDTRSGNSIFSRHSLAKSAKKRDKEKQFLQRLGRFVSNSSIVIDMNAKKSGKWINVWISRKESNVATMTHENSWLWTRMMHS